MLFGFAWAPDWTIDIDRSGVWDLERFPDFVRARSEAFTGGVPTSTAVGAPLLFPEFLVEVNAIAEIGD